jgi:small subunit ribosomal protein S1
MIHVSDISWTRKINHPSEVLKKGMDVEAQVLEVDRENQRISVGIKQLADDPWDKIDALYKIGDLVDGKVSKLASFGAFVGLEHDIDGLVHISQVSEERVEKIKDVLSVGEDVTARVIKIDRSDRRIGLSIKAANYSQEQLKEEEAVLDALKPGEDLVALQHAFDTFGDEEEESEAPAAKPKEVAPAAKEPEATADTETPTESEDAPAASEEETPAAEEAKGDETKSDE